MNDDTNKKQHLAGYIDNKGKNRSELDDVQHPQGGIILICSYIKADKYKEQ